MLKILVKETGAVFEGIAHDFCDYIIDETDFTEEYDSMLDECYEPWEFGGATYYPSDIISRLDYIAYSIGKTEYTDSRIYGDLLYDLENGETGIYYIGDLTLDIIENENE